MHISLNKKVLEKANYHILPEKFQTPALTYLTKLNFKLLYVLKSMLIINQENQKKEIYHSLYARFLSLHRCSTKKKSSFKNNFYYPRPSKKVLIPSLSTPSYFIVVVVVVHKTSVLRRRPGPL